MKKIFLFINCLFLFTLGFGQNYKSQLDKINNFLKTFDNGYYGYISIEDNILCTNIKNVGQSKVSIYDISEIKVTESNRKVEIFCKSGDCVTGVNGSKYSSMTYRTTSDFDAKGLADDLNALINAFKNKGIVQSDNNFPEIIILSPDISSEFNAVVQNAEITIEGKVVDASDISEVLINGRDVSLNGQGYFTIPVTLATGENLFTIRATDINQKTATKKFVIERTLDR